MRQLLSRTRQEEILILQRRPLGERDDLLVCLGSKTGRFSAVSRGSRSSRGRLAGLLEPPVELEARFREGHKLDSLAQPCLLCSFASLKSRLDALLTAGFLARLFLECLPEKAYESGVYELLRALFLQLDEGGSCTGVGLLGQDRLLAQLGIEPHLDTCLGCDSEEVSGFSSRDGGVLCGACYRGDGFAISGDTLLALRQLRGLTCARAVEVAVLRPGVVNGVGRVYKAQFQTHLGIGDGVFRKVLTFKSGV